MRSTSFGTKILGVRRDLLRTLPVPICSTTTVGRVAALVRTCVRERERFLASVTAARGVVMGIPIVADALGACERRVRRSVLWEGPLPTLGAWNFAGAGAALKLLKSKTDRTLGDFLTTEGIRYGSRSRRVPCKLPFGVDFVAQRDAFLIRPIPRRVVLPDAASEDLLEPEGSLMLAGRGTLGEGEIFGRCAQVTGPLRGLTFTGDMLRVCARTEHSNFLYAYLSTHLGIQLVRTAAVGTKILQIREDLLRATPVPDATKLQLDEINNFMDASNKSRTLAAESEAEAIRIIEQEVLPQWLA